MSLWFAICALFASILAFPFIDVSIRNGVKRRARGRQLAQTRRHADA